MNSRERVQDDEELYRNVRGKLEDKEYSIQNGELIIEYHAFWDSSLKPSVDRAKLKNNDPASSLLSKTNGIVSINAGDVRAIGAVKTKHKNEVIADHWRVLRVRRDSGKRCSNNFTPPCQDVKTLAI